MDLISGPVPGRYQAPYAPRRAPQARHEQFAELHSRTQEVV